MQLVLRVLGPILAAGRRRLRGRYTAAVAVLWRLCSGVRTVCGRVRVVRPPLTSHRPFMEARQSAARQRLQSAPAGPRFSDCCLIFSYQQCSQRLQSALSACWSEIQRLLSSAISSAVRGCSQWLLA